MAMRYWVKFALRRIGMQSGVAGPAWNGHDSGDGMDPMDTRYDNPGVKDIFAEPSG